LNAAGTGWRCERGYRNEGTSCIALQVPRNAHIDYSGNAWECDEHHRRVEATCMADTPR